MKYILCNNCKQAIEIHSKKPFEKCPNCGNKLRNKQVLKNSGMQKLNTKDRPRT